MTALPCHTGVAGNVPRYLQPVAGIGLEVRIDRILGKHAAHPLQYPGVDLAEIARPRDLHFTVHLPDVYQLTLNVQFLHLPDAPGKCKPVADRGRRRDGSDLVRAGTDGVVLRILENGIEFEGLEQALPRQSDNQPFLLRHLQVFMLQHGHEQCAVVLLCHGGKRRERQHALRQTPWRQLTESG